MPRGEHGLALAECTAAPGAVLRARKAYAKSPPPHCQPSSACAWRSTACRSPLARRCSAGVRGNERMIVGAYTDGNGGVCPMLAAHRWGGRTDFLSFARTWDRFTRAGRDSRAATERELRILVDAARSSLRDADGWGSTRRSRSTVRSRPRRERDGMRRGAVRATRGSRASIARGVCESRLLWRERARRRVAPLRREAQPRRRQSARRPCPPPSRLSRRRSHS